MRLRSSLIAQTSLVLVELTLKRFLFRIFGEDHLDSRPMRFPLVRPTLLSISISIFKRSWSRLFETSRISFASHFKRTCGQGVSNEDGEIRLSRMYVGVAGKVSRTRGRVKLIRLF
jgi:hypothetical protein